MLFLRKSPLRHPAGYVAHQYGVTMATAPYQDQISTCHLLGPIQVLNVLNHVVLYEAFILSLIFNLYKMRIPTKSAVKLI